MNDMHRTQTRLQNLEAQTKAQGELLLMLARTIIATSPDASKLLGELHAAAAYAGPSRAQKELAALAKAVAGGTPSAG